jgi:hypothetical protein
MSLGGWLRNFFGLAPTISEYQKQLAEHNGDCLTVWDRSAANYQLGCRHKKGGCIGQIDNPRAVIAKALQKGQGSSYSVIKHQMMNGDIWVLCLRCGRKWKPPIRREYKTDLDFFLAIKEYNDMVECDTNNSMSTALQWQFSKNGRLDLGEEVVRKSLASS